VLPLRRDGPFEASLPSRISANLRYYNRKLARRRAVRFETADAQSLPELLDALMRVHGARWSMRGLRECSRTKR
jgi:hypothetical protein